MNSALSDLSTTFDAPYSPSGRDSIPLERLLRTLLLRWFLGLGVDDPVWDATTFTKNRDHLLEGDVAVKFLAALLAQPKVKVLRSGERFSVYGTVLEAWASSAIHADLSRSRVGPAHH